MIIIKYIFPILLSIPLFVLCIDWILMFFYFNNGKKFEKLTRLAMCCSCAIVIIIMICVVYIGIYNILHLCK